MLSAANSQHISDVCISSMFATSHFQFCSRDRGHDLALDFSLGAKTDIVILANAFEVKLATTLMS